MLHLLNSKYVAVTSPNAILDDASATTNEIDTLGFDYCTILVQLGATDIAMGALKVQESDTSGSDFADVTGLVASGTTGDGRLPTATDDNKVFAFFIDLRGRKRYLDLVATAGNGSLGTYVSAVAILSRAATAPSSSSGRGLGGQFAV